jgi:transcription termination/antitermination protein NusG
MQNDDDEQLNTQEVSDKDEVKSDEDSQLSEAGEVSSETTSSDVDEPDQAGSEQSEEAELENQNQMNESTEEPEIPSQDTPGKWYVVHTYSGHENKVAAALRQRIEAEHLEDRIIDILVPTQNKIEIKGGRKTEVKEKIFPGYILVKMVLDDTSWLAVRTIPGVTSFVGMGNKPTVISDKEVSTIIKYSQIEQPTFKQVFSPDDTVKIADGPFAEMIGKVDSVDSERGKVRVLVSIFGRETPVELDFLQVQKI